MGMDAISKWCGKTTVGNEMLEELIMKYSYFQTI